MSRMFAEMSLEEHLNPLCSSPSLFANEARRMHKFGI
jgi:hypothetical protein